MCVSSIYWDDAYSLGIPEIDFAHIRLFQQFNEFITMAEEKRTAAELSLKFNTIVKDVFEHFEEEEQVMRDIGYPAYESHKTIHDTLRQDAEEVAQDLKLADQEIDILPFVTCLQSLIIDHIIHQDCQILTYIENNKA